MASQCKNAEAVKQLLDIDDPQHLLDNLTDMWEVWVTSDVIDGSPASTRADMLLTYKGLREMLRTISREDSKSC